VLGGAASRLCQIHVMPTQRHDQGMTLGRKEIKLRTA